MSDLDDEPNYDIIPSGVTGLSYAAVMESVAEVIISDFVDLGVTLETPKQKSKHKAKGKDTDHVQEYAKDVLSMGLLYFEFQDAICHGAGKRVFVVWKFLFLIFRATGHTNYTLEAFIDHVSILLPFPTKASRAVADSKIY